MLLFAFGLLTACDGMFVETFSPPLELDGVWHLEWVETNGEREVPVLGQNTQSQPWVSFEDRINGNAGCNDFGSSEAYSYDYSAGVLVPGIVFQNAAGCHSEEGFDLHRMEEVLMAMLGDNSDGLEVSVDEDTMIWFSETTRLGFSRHEAPPERPFSEPPPISELGRLNCGDGVIVEDRIPDVGQEPLEVAQDAAPDVVGVIEGRPLWHWGLNQNNTVIVGLALGDADGADYQVWTCDPPLDSSTPYSEQILVPESCLSTPEPFPEAFHVPEGNEVVAEFAFNGGGVVLIQSLDEPTYFNTIECFPDGGTGFTEGGPGETWKECFRWDYSDSGYTILFFENPASEELVLSDRAYGMTMVDDVGIVFIEGQKVSAAAALATRVQAEGC